jgi:hypothetical protein
MVINQLPPYIEQYPSKEQEVLTEFLEILKYHGEADYRRGRLSKRFIDYIQKYNQTQNYLDYPFLWFAIDYFANANLKLSLAEYDGKSFYAYLANPFRRSFQSEGGFLLIKNQVPLSDIKWEQLQVTSTRIELTLNEEQLLLLKNVYHAINERGIFSLQSRQLKKQITPSNNSFPSMRDLTHFFMLLGSKWELWFFTPAFDLKYLYVHFKLAKNTPFAEIIDFHNPENRTLCNSWIYRVPESENEYSGYFVIPKTFIDDLKDFLRHNENKYKISVLRMDEIITERVSFSLALYFLGRGWQDSPSASSRPQESDFYITPEFNQDWCYTQFPDPLALIQFYCKHKPIYYFGNLPLDLVSKKPLNLEAIRHSAAERGLVKYLYEKRVCMLAFDSPRMYYAYSPTFFEIHYPISSLDNLRQVISWLPYARIFISEKSIFLWAFLTSGAIELLKNEGECRIRQIISYHYPQSTQLSWYDSNKLTWIPPVILTS